MKSSVALTSVDASNRWRLGRTVAMSFGSTPYHCARPFHMPSHLRAREGFELAPMSLTTL